MRSSPHTIGRARAPLVLALLALAACDSTTGGGRATARGQRAGGTDTIHLGLGIPVDSVALAAIDIDANPSGVGLPAGSGTAADGAPIYARQCASCHGQRGEGMGPNPKLIGAAAPDSFAFARDAAIPKTVGNYWPYATTLYDYIHRAMPLNAPGSLTPHETYSLVAFLLEENGVIGGDAVMNATSLPAVRMPARDHFVPDDRTGGGTFR